MARTVMVIVLMMGGSALWAQTKPKPAPAGPEPQLQTQKPTAPPLQTQQLPGQQAPVQTQRPAAAAQAAPARPTEVFLMPMPKGWKQVSVDEQYNIRTIQYVPEGQTPDKAEEMLRSLAFYFVRDAPLDNFMALATRLPKDECQDAMTTPVAKGLINGFESVFATRFCTKNRKSGQGEVTMFKLIQGKQALYLGERTWRIKAFGKDKPPVAKEVFEGWSEYMKAITVCVVDDPVRPCPKGAAKGP
ncbi:MAG TPA: hypothetical protein VF934_00775 [Burkholderiales bacterium]